MLVAGCVLVLGLATLGGAAVTRARADTAADAGALAAADQVALGASADLACAAARATVDRNGSRLVACIADAAGVTVRVTREGHGLVATAHARAEIDDDCAADPAICIADIARGQDAGR